MPFKSPEKRRAYQRTYQTGWRATHRAQCSSYTRRYRRGHLEKVRAHDHLRDSLRKRVERYGAEIMELLARCDGRCEACGRPFGKTKGMHVDHDHATGQIRGLLCQKCNMTLGLMGDDAELLRKLIAYLEA